MKKTLYCLGVILWILGASPSSAKEKTIIAVVKSRDIAFYNTALKGFKAALKERKVIYKPVLYSLGLKDAENSSIIQEIKSIKPDLILTLGSTATGLVRQEIKDKPVVFSMVLNPDISGYVQSMQSPGNNITGSSMDISIRSQFESLLTASPDTKKIGVMYNPQENQIIIDRALKVAKDMGLQLLARKVYSEKEVPWVLEDINHKIDALWAVSDNTIFIPQSIHFILLYTLRNSMIFMGISSSFVEAGALLALTCDYEDIGRQSGEIAVRILAGETPGNIPISTPRKTLLSINLKTARQIGLEVPPAIIERADEIFGKQ